MQQLSDEELIGRSRASGAASPSDPFIEELFRRHQRKVALWCLRYSNDRDEALDLAQEVLAQTFRRLDTFQGNSKFSTWLYTVCRNHCLNHVKSRAAQPDTTGEDALSFLAAPDGGPMEEQLSRKRQIELVRGWIRNSLEDTERRVFLMHFLDEMPLDAITRALRLTNASGAKAFIVSARRKLSEAARRWRLQNES
jgi:RNA polymerase sigma-70 factor (ECF subfamily)